MSCVSCKFTVLIQEQNQVQQCLHNVHEQLSRLQKLRAFYNCTCSFSYQSRAADHEQVNLHALHLH